MFRIDKTWTHHVILHICYIYLEGGILTIIIRRKRRNIIMLHFKMY
jgi:hypothetical protein